jgi:hypothetical protein
LSPPESERVPVRAFEAALDKIEAKLGLAGQPRVVIFHEKEGRRHAHCVWSRIDAESMTAIDLPHFKMKLQDVSRQLYIEHGWHMPDGLIGRNLTNPLNFDQREWFQAQRTGQDPRAIKAVFQQCWAASDSGKALRQALEQRGYHLAHGDRRGVVALDIHGEVYAVARWAGVKTKEVIARTGDQNALPAVEEVRQRLAGIVRDKLGGFIESATVEFSRATLAMEAKRIATVERHRSARRELQEKQDERWITEARARGERFRKGFRGLWDRLTGRHSKLRRENEIETANCTERDANEKQTLIDRQLAERQALQREIRQARRVHLREVTRLHRQIAGYRQMDHAPAMQTDDQGRGRTIRQRRTRREISGP